MQRIRIVALVAAAMVIGGCSASSAASSASTVPTTTAASGQQPAGGEVVIHTFAFGPQTISVAAGTSVTWTNQDDILHTVTAGTAAHPEKAFDAKVDGVGSTFTFTFDKQGTYHYHCSIHEVMEGIVTVT